MNHSLVNFEQSIEFLLHFNRLVFAMGGKSCQNETISF